MNYIIGFLFISIVGTLLHFTYDFSNHNKAVGVFSAVNESTWEHVKMALTAYFMWMLIDAIKYFINPNFFTAKLVGAVVIIITIPLLFYGYKLFTKKSVLAIDISIFFIAIALAQYVNYLLINTSMASNLVKYISLGLLIILIIGYLLFTLFPPKHFLFKDPLTDKYGIKGHK